MTHNLHPDLNVEELGYDGILFCVDPEKLNIYQCKYHIFQGEYKRDHYIFYIGQLKVDTNQGHPFRLFFAYDDAFQCLKQMIEQESMALSKDVKQMEQVLQTSKNRLEEINKKLVLF